MKLCLDARTRIKNMSIVTTQFLSSAAAISAVSLKDKAVDHPFLNFSTHP